MFAIGDTVSTELSSRGLIKNIHFTTPVSLGQEDCEVTPISYLITYPNFPDHGISNYFDHWVSWVELYEYNKDIIRERTLDKILKNV